MIDGAPGANLGSAGSPRSARAAPLLDAKKAGRKAERAQPLLEVVSAPRQPSGDVLNRMARFECGEEFEIVPVIPRQAQIELEGFLPNLLLRPRYIARDNVRRIAQRDAPPEATNFQVRPRFAAVKVQAFTHYLLTQTTITRDTILLNRLMLLQFPRRGAG